MPVEPVNLETEAPVGSPITSGHFGVNFIDAWEHTSIEKQIDLKEILADLGPITVRWPGGGDIEKYRIIWEGSKINLTLRESVGPTGNGDPLDMADLEEFFVALNTTGSQAIIEIPTFWLVSSKEEGTAWGKSAKITEGEAAGKASMIKAFVKEAMKLAKEQGVEIAGFEIGNEYRGYYDPSGYAGVLNAILDDVATGIKESTSTYDPKIIVQIDDSSNNRTPEDLATRNQTIIDKLNDDARDLVDAVSVHYYYDEGEAPKDGSDRVVNQWRESYDKISGWVSEFSKMGDAWTKDVDVMFTEWGVVKGMPTNTKVDEKGFEIVSQEDIDKSNFGMMAMAPTLEIFSQMVQHGVDGASIWPTTMPHATGLYNLNGTQRPLGVLFEVMADNLVGKKAMEVSTGATGFDVHAFLEKGPVGDTNATAFVSSLKATKQTVTIQLDDLHALSGGKVQVYVIELVDGSADGKYEARGKKYDFLYSWSDPDSIAQLKTLQVADLTNGDGSISLTLDAYEVAVVHYEAFDRIISNSSDYRDSSSAGTDDRVYGTDGNDTLHLGAGRDWAEGKLGDDKIYSDTGNDTLEGNQGNDYLESAGGSDIIYGGSGADVLLGSDGNDTLYGGTGNDVFVFNTDITITTRPNVDRIHDFNVAYDTIRLDNDIFTGLAAGTLAKSAFVSNTSGAASTNLHRIIYDNDSGALYFDRDGSGPSAAFKFATLDRGLGLTSADFTIV